MGLHGVSGGPPNDPPTGQFDDGIWRADFRESSEDESQAEAERALNDAAAAPELERRHRAGEDLSIDEYKQLLAFAERTISVWRDRARVWKERAHVLREQASARARGSDAARLVLFGLIMVLSVGLLAGAVVGAAHFME